MKGQKYQDPQIEERTDVKNPYYFIRASVPVITASGLEHKRTPFRIGPSTGKDKITMREAKARKEQIMAPINNGRFLIQSQIPFTLVLENYVVAGLPAVATTTRQKYSSVIKHIRAAFSDLRMCDIDRYQVTAWLRTHESLCHTTLETMRNVLSAIFTFAKEMKFFEGENPCRGVKVGGRESGRSQELPSRDGLMRFLGALVNTAIISAEGARLIVLVAILTGLRISEVLGLQVRDIDPVSETIKVQRRWARGDCGPTKTKKSKRTRQILGLAAELLEYGRGKAPDAFIFGREDQNGDPPDDRDLQQHVFRPAAERAAIYLPGFGIHRFRHLNISWRQEVGAHPFEAQKAAGHAKPSTTFDYTQTDVEREKAHVRAIWDRVTMSPDGGVQ